MPWDVSRCLVHVLSSCVHVYIYNVTHILSLGMFVSLVSGVSLRNV